MVYSLLLVIKISIHILYGFMYGGGKENREWEREIGMPMTGFTEQEIVFANRMMFDVLNKIKK